MMHESERITAGGMSGHRACRRLPLGSPYAARSPLYAPICLYIPLYVVICRYIPPLRNIPELFPPPAYRNSALLRRLPPPGAGSTSASDGPTPSRASASQEQLTRRRLASSEQCPRNRAGLFSESRGQARSISPQARPIHRGRVIERRRHRSYEGARQRLARSLLRTPPTSALRAKEPKSLIEPIWSASCRPPAGRPLTSPFRQEPPTSIRLRRAGQRVHGAEPSLARSSGSRN